MSFHIVFWYWWALSAVLLVCEMMLPGVVFLFLALGAALAGMVLVLEPELSFEMQLVIFAVVSVASAVGLRPLLRNIQKHSDDPNLNARGDSLIGKVLVLDQPILRGRGRVILGDGS